VTRLPAGATWGGIVGIGVLSGIGFTMALFIANLAFGPGAELDQAKVGVLSASVVAALAGLAFLARILPRARVAAAPTRSKEAPTA
jgi:NhaA family Na+:H+ antiporter